MLVSQIRGIFNNRKFKVIKNFLKEDTNYSSNMFMIYMGEKFYIQSTEKGINCLMKLIKKEFPINSIEGTINSANVN